MKRIGMVGVNTFNPNLCDGVSASMSELLRFLKQQGNHVFISNYLTAEPYKTRVLRYPEEIPDAEILSRDSRHCRAMLNGVDIYQEQLPYAEHEALRGPPDVLKKIIRGIQDAQADYIFTIDRNQTTLLAVSLTGTPGAHFFRSPPYVPEYAGQPLFSNILRKKTVFAISDFTRAYVADLLDVSAVTWPPVFDFGRCRAAQKREQPRTVGYYSAGRHKGDEIMVHVIREMKDVSFVVMGRNYGSGALPPNVEYLGDVSDNRLFYEKTGVLLVPSVAQEGFSRVIMEAAANGIPAIANRIGGIPEAMGSSGILIDTDSGRDAPEKIADKYVSAIRTVLSDEETYADYCRNALQRAEEYEQDQYRMSRSVYAQYIQPCL